MLLYLYYPNLKSKQMTEDSVKSTIVGSGCSIFQFGITECRYFPKPTRPLTGLELVYINKGEGLCFSGDGIIQFRPGDLFFFSANTSHYFRSAPQFYAPNYPLKCGSTYLRFSEDILPIGYLRHFDCDNLKNLIVSARQGLKWSNKEIGESLIREIEKMELTQGFERYIHLLRILNMLGEKVPQGVMIATEREPERRRNSDRAYNCVVDYISHNFHRNITLDELADRADMNRTALCRHFKGHANRSIFDFLLDFRINFAQHQLTTTQISISEIATSSGFNNLPNFNVQFKRLSGLTPSEYRIKSRNQIIEQ